MGVKNETHKRLGDLQHSSGDTKLQAALHGKPKKGRSPAKGLRAT